VNQRLIAFYLSDSWDFVVRPQMYTTVQHKAVGWVAFGGGQAITQGSYI
jgi:hypothetical protein